uniref:Malic enzyme 1, NADP(+)-dependent, cytosolic n=1 Tax=Schistosoma japonicum TaxID=6182 RepID=C1L3N1_SCHJA|nr:malic enzyme 1, NADP(+)-dependent, cytosolic [Schistosoma japonicum]
MSYRYLPSLIRNAPRLKARGIEILRNPRTNKGFSYTLHERQLLGIHGLLPPNPQNQDVEEQRVMSNLYQLDDNLSRYMMLMALQDLNEKLFYKTIRTHLEYCLPIIYTPTVGLACLNFGFVFRRPRGIYITIQDKGHIFTLLKNWPNDTIKTVVMTDGERILGFGDMGANGMAIPLSKAALYTAFGGLQPYHCLPIMLDVGTNNEKLLEDEFYVGLRRKRATGEEYISFMDEVVESLSAHYGPNVCLHFADLKNSNAFQLLERYRSNYITFNDDIQGSAVVIVSGLLTASRITKKKISQNTYLFYGSGGASIGIARLLVQAIIEEGFTEDEAKSRIFMMDSRGLLVTNRELTKAKSEFARSDYPQIDSLLEAIRLIRPSVLIGSSAQSGAFSRDILRELSAISRIPIIFVLSNSSNLGECTAQMAYKATEWRCIFVSGSPSEPVLTPDDRILKPSQGNNCYVFPSLINALSLAVIRPLTNKLLLTAAKKLSELVTDDDLHQGSVLPSITRLPAISKEVSCAIIEQAYKDNIAYYTPEPQDKMEFIESHYYDHRYINFTPDQYVW